MILVVDIGASKTLVATLDETLEHPQILEHRHFATPRTPKEFLDEFTGQYATMNKEGLKACVFGVPATVKDGEITGTYANLPEWKNENGIEFNPAKGLVEQIDAPIFITNDADLAAFGEAAQLNFPDTLLYLSVGTGMGVGVVTNTLIPMKSEAGHMMIEVAGKLVEWEKIASGTAIRRDFGKPASEITDESAWRMIAARLVLGLGVLIPVINPDFVVFGGGVSTNFDKFSTYLPELLSKRLHPSVDIPPILKSREPSWAVVYGGFYYLKVLTQ